MTAVPSPAGLVIRLVAQLAATLARPLDRLDSAACLAEIGAGEALAALPGAPAFRRPLNRAVSQALGFGELDLSAAFLDRLANSAASRLCALLVGQPIALVRHAALQVSAAVLHKRIVGLVLRADRERLRQVLGEMAVQSAAQDVLLLHAPLVALDDGPATVIDIVDIEAARSDLVVFGLHVLGRFIALVEPALAAVFRLRLPGGLGPAPALARMAEIHCLHIVKLLRRRIPEWAPFIA